MFRQLVRRNFVSLGDFATLNPKEMSGKKPGKIHNFGRCYLT